MMANQVEALLHWGIGYDAAGYYVAVKVELAGRATSFETGARFRSYRAADMALCGLAMDKQLAGDLIARAADGWGN